MLQLCQEPIVSEEDCYRFAHIQFKRFFIKTINRLLELNPIDSKNQDGSPFWSAEKRPPVPLTLDFSNVNHRNFINYCSKLVGDVFGIKFAFNEEKAKSVTVADEDVVTAEEVSAVVDQYQDNMIGLLKEKFKFKPANNVKISVIHFEKDDPTNGHI